MRLPRPVYYSCLISVLVAGAVRSVAQPARPVPLPASATPRESRDPRAFQIPPADASESLAAFSLQSGTALVYVVEHVRGVRTNGIEGRFRPREALERLLANTVLAVAEDTRSGALMIKRTEPSRPGSPNGSTSASEPGGKNRQTLKTQPTKPRAGWLTALLALLTAADLPGQSTAPGAAEERKDDVVTLSPFTVSTERDAGFVAASSLAGGRLASDLKDTPVSYSVLTREFIDALGITSLTDASQWAVNVTQQPDDGRAEIFTDTNRGLSFRGVSGGTQRNFFSASGNFDSYNLDRYDYARGPNSILFGTGSLGGTANVVTKRAEPSKSLGEVRVTIGSWNDYRANLDLNRPINSRVAVRINVVGQTRDGWRDRDFEEKAAATLATTWKISRETELRAEVEGGTSRRANGLTVVGDRLSGWDGTSTFTAALLTTPSDANARGIGRATNFIWSPGSGVDGVVNYANEAITLAGNANAAVPVGGTVAVGPTFPLGGQSIHFTQNLPTNRFDRAIAGSKFRVPGREFTPSPDGPLLTQKLANATLALTHVVGKRLFLEAAGNWARWRPTAEIGASRGFSDTFIDINANLPTGQPNPNFLQPFNQGERTITFTPNENYAYRLAAAYVLDRTRWGNFRFSLLGGGSSDRSERRFYTHVLQLDPDPRNWSTANLLRTRYYWNQSSRPSVSPGRVNYIDPVTGTTRPVEVSRVLDTRATSNTANRRSEPVYLQAATTGSLFRGRLRLVAAARHDRYHQSSQQGKARKDYAANWDGVTPDFAPAPPADFLTLSFTPKDAQGNPTGSAQPAITRPRDAAGFALPQYANDRFRDDYSSPEVKGGINTASIGGVFHLNRIFSVFANRAETYQPPGVLQRINGQLFGPTTTNGWDAGVRVNFGDGRFSLNVARYHAKELGQSLDPNGITGISIAGNINAILQANVAGDRTSGGRNRRGLEDVIGTYADTRDRESEGYEFDLTANLTRSWRLLANVALPRAYQSNPLPDTRAYLAQNDRALRQIVADAGGLIDAKNAATVDTSIPINDRSPDVNSAIAAWNMLQVMQSNLVVAPQKIFRLTELTGNIFTDYTFKEGRLNGLRLGGGVNYRGKTVIGYRGSDTITAANNPALAIDDPAVDALTPVYTRGYGLVTVTAGYTWKLKHGRSVMLDFRISNLLNEIEPIYYNTVQRPPGGNLATVARVATPQGFYYQTPRSYSLSAAFKF